MTTTITPSRPGNTSLLSSLAALPLSEQAEILAGLTDEQAEALRYDWSIRARENQLPPRGAWRIWLVLSGRGFGKTRVGSEWVREQIETFQHVNIIGPNAADVRDVMIEGESGILSVCRPDERPEYLPSRRLLRWPNGAQTLCFSAEDPEQLRGPQHQRLWCDEIAAWSNHTREETWTQATLGLRLPPDPRAVLTTTPKPVPLLRRLVQDPTVTITKGTTYENRANLAPAFFSEVITQYEGTRLGRQELEAELLLDEGLAYPWSSERHIVKAFEIPDWWERFEGFDHGKTHAAAWISFATDDEGNHVAHAAYYGPGDPADHAKAILNLRATMPTDALCHADPTIRNSAGAGKNWKGQEISVELSYNEAGLYFVPGQNDRRAGYVRLSELLKLDPEHSFPSWHPRAGEKGAPRLFVMDTGSLEPLIEQIRDAPLEDVDNPLSKFPGEAVDREWEGRLGHAHAAARYALMSRQRASVEPIRPPEDPRARILWEHERRMDGTDGKPYEWS